MYAKRFSEHAGLQHGKLLFFDDFKTEKGMCRKRSFCGLQCSPCGEGGFKEQKGGSSNKKQVGIKQQIGIKQIYWILQ